MIRVFFGGSFDPIHDGHLDIVRHIHHTLFAQNATFEISFLPTAGNPFKGKPTPPTHRLAILDLACKMLKYEKIFCQICPLEIHQTPPVYTIDTMQILADHHPHDERIFVMGGDSLASLHLWKDHDKILTLTKIWAFARTDNTTPIQDDLTKKITLNFDEFLKTVNYPIFYDDTPISAISSSQIRQNLLNNQQPTHLPKLVFDYIKNHQLYQNVL